MTWKIGPKGLSLGNEKFITHSRGGNIMLGQQMSRRSFLTLTPMTAAADHWAGNKTAYYKEKDRWTDILIRRTEDELIPGLQAMIEVKEAGTPLTCWRYTGNTEGAIYGFEQSMDNAFMNRIHNRTPVRGLYLASAWGNPGGGFGGVLRAGELTFEQIMEDWS
jgi:prolycopene isomerase